MIALHKGQYERWAFVYRPIPGDIWYIPGTADNLKKVKTAIAAQPKNSSVKGLRHEDVALELVQTMCFLMDKRPTSFVSSNDPLFTSFELKHREALIRRALALVKELFGTDNEVTIDLLGELKETLRREGRQSEGAAVNRQMLQIKSDLLNPDVDWR